MARETPVLPHPARLLPIVSSPGCGPSDIGACLTGRSAYLGAKGLLAAHLIRQAWSRTLETGTPQPPGSWADTHPIGRLLIPRLGYDEIILEGACPRNRIVDPDDAALLAPTGSDVVTLITCYPFGLSPRSPQRYVVRAEALGAAAT